MTYVYFVPKWFFGYDIAMELIFTIVTLAVAYYSFKVYNIYKQRASKLFGIAFIFIAASYFLWVLINLFLLSQINESTEGITINQANIVGLIGLYAYMLLFVIGLSILTYITLKVKGKRIFAFILLMSLFAILISYNKTVAFHIVSSILLVFIVFHYMTEYSQNKNKKTLIVLLAFLFMLCTSINFIFLSINYYYYVSGHLLNLIAYGLILTNLLIIRKNEQKKEQA
jgi:hypothetical protein